MSIAADKRQYSYGNSHHFWYFLHDEDAVDDFDKILQGLELYSQFIISGFVFFTNSRLPLQYWQVPHFLDSLRT